MRALLAVGWLVGVGCDFPRPTQALDARTDDAAAVLDGGMCGEDLCPLGCVVSENRCRDVAPSNGLAMYLDMSASEPDLDLGAEATINTSDGSVIVDGSPIVVKSVAVPQDAAPTIRVLVVRRLLAMRVTVTGQQALAIVADGEIRIGGVLAASAQQNIGGAGRFNEPICRGGDTVSPPASGAGGGGFGGDGGNGGTASNANGTSAGGKHGAVTGNASLVPLRGGCDGGCFSGSVCGAGGGAIQLVSRVSVHVEGAVAANGSSFSSGGSGGGILIEAPIVEITGAVVANGGAGGSGCFVPANGEDGRLDGQPAAPGSGCTLDGSNGGRGGARNGGPSSGVNVTRTTGNSLFAGHGGGGVGRIRINTTSGGLHAPGILSPIPSTGELATR